MQIISFNGKVGFKERELTGLRFFKVRTAQNCSKCGTQFPKGAFCWGRGNRRYCLKCRDIIFESLKQEIRFIIKEVKAQERKYSENKKDYETNNVVASL